MSEALRIRESREKENKQREQIFKQFIEETNRREPAPEPNNPNKNPGTEPKPVHKPWSKLEPEPEPESDAELDESEPESDSENESEPESETGTGTRYKMAKQTSTNIRNKPKKTKPIPPPEEYIIPKLTHINLNDKLEYNRSTIPFPDDKPPTEELKKSEGKIRSQIEHLRTLYLRNKAEAKAKAEADLGSLSNSKSKSKNKPKSKQVPKLGPNPLILAMNDKVDFDRIRMMKDSTIMQMFAKHDLKFDLEWKRLNEINIYALDHMDSIDIKADIDVPARDNMDILVMDNGLNTDMNVLRLKLNIDVDIDSRHGPDASRNENLWPHDCDPVKLEENMKLVNMDMIPLNDDNGLCIAMNSRQDVGLEPIQESPSVFEINTSNTPPI